MNVERLADGPGVLIELCVHFTLNGQKAIFFKVSGEGDDLQVECPNYEPRRIDFGKGWKSV